MAASIVARIADGRGGAKALWGLLGCWRVRWTWYAAALLVFPALLVAAALVTRSLPGAVWTAWHLPFWIVLGELQLFGPTYRLLSWLWISAGSVYLTWLMNNPGNSLPMALLVHGGYNLLSDVVPAHRMLVALGWAVAIGVIAAFGPKTLRRSR